MSNADWYVKQLSQFTGWKVVQPVKSPPDDFLGDEFFGLLLQNGTKRKILWFLRDDEGNGPGSFEIQSD